MSGTDFAENSQNKPEKTLLDCTSHTAGRHALGHNSVRLRGGGLQQFYRVIDLQRHKEHMADTVKDIEYELNRTEYIALLHYEDGVKTDFLAHKGLKVGDKVYSGDDVDIQVGHTLKLKNIPAGTTIHNIELKPGQGATSARSAGVSALLLGKDNDKYVTIQLASGEVRLVLAENRAKFGAVGNETHELISIGKAGRKRWLGFRPTVRGTVMNQYELPHGGGEGKAHIGRPTPLTPWGQKTLGKKTRELQE